MSLWQRAWSPPAAQCVATSGGETQAICTSYTEAASGRRPTLWEPSAAATPRGMKIAVIVGAYTAPPRHPLRWHQTVALHSKDRGSSWSRKQVTRPTDNQPELLDAALVE